MLHLLIISYLVSACFAQTQNDTVEDINNLSKFATPCRTPNDDMALCLEIHKCHLFSKEDITPTHEAYNFMQASSCGPENAKILRVCCGKHNNFISQIEKNMKSTESPSASIPDEIVGNDNPLPKNCGKHKQTIVRNRIFGGTEAALGEFPWLVRLIHKHPGGYKNYGCGGFLIHKKYIVTAAHCVSSKTFDIFGPLVQVVLGDHDLDEDLDCTKTKPKFCSDKPLYIDTGTPITYGGYNKTAKNHNNDVALVPLKENVKFSDFIQPLCLLEAPSQMQTMYITGWGKTESDDQSTKKLKVEVPRVPQQVCSDKYKTIDVILNKKNQICAGDEGRDSCSGDSGGPLMIEEEGIWYAEGIVSFGYGCARADWPGVYSNVPRYTEWIKNTIKRRAAIKKRKRRT